MVELPSGKMKSREGTVVDADDLIDEMVNTARETSQELGKLEGLTDEGKENTFRMISLGALKYFILKVDPKKNMLFNPEESIDFNGNTGPFIQYTHARIQSVLRKALDQNIDFSNVEIGFPVNHKEKQLMQLISTFPQVINDAGKDLSPSLIANYVYDLAKEFNQFYHDITILGETDENLKKFRLMLADYSGKTINYALSLLGIESPQRM